MKNILLKIEDDQYYKLTELKGQFKVDTWEELIAKLVENAEVTKA
jgi:predicted CopG family antitoxin